MIRKIHPPPHVYPDQAFARTARKIKLRRHDPSPSRIRRGRSAWYELAYVWA